MSMKSKWIKFKSGVDHFVSGIDGLGFSGIALHTFFGVCIGSIMSLLTLLVQSEYKGDFSEELDGMQVFEGGAIIDLPSDCGGYGSYLISEKPNGGIELSRITHDRSSAYVMGRSAQKQATATLEKCMTTLSQSVASGDFEFADEFRFANSITYSEAGLIHETNSQVTELRKDLIDWDNTPDTLEDLVEDRADYDDGGENTALFKDEFNKAATVWASYMAQKNDSDPYFEGIDIEGLEIKAPERYQKYESYNMTLNHWYGMMGGVALLFTCAAGISSSSRRPHAYRERQAQRADQLAALARNDVGSDSPSSPAA